MTINLDLVIDSAEDIDMKVGLESMQGVSDAVRYAAESILTGRTPERLTYKSKVRTSLKNSFKGSYGHIFSLNIYDEELMKRLNSIGRKVFIELISYLISESLYREGNRLSPEAQKILGELGETVEEVAKQLRVSSLEKIHAVSVKFGHDIKIRYRKNHREQVVIAKFDSDTAKVLQAEQTDEKFDLNIIVTRLNIYTGNGRLQIEDQNETIAFGFGIGYRSVKIEAKKLFSENLNYNNGLERDKCRYLKVLVAPIKLRDGKVIKYIVKGLYEI